MAQRLAPQQLSPVPSQINSPQAKLVYLFLEATGGATVDDVNETLAMKKIDVLSVLASLEGAGLVDRRGERYVASA